MTVPQGLEDSLDLLPSTGRPFRVLVQQMAGEVLAVGRHGLLVDMPGNQPLGSLPLWAGYAAERIEDWQRGRVRGRSVTTRVKLSEPDPMARDGRTQIRELLLEDGFYVVRLWRQSAQGKWVLAERHEPSRGGQRLDFIPLFFSVSTTWIRTLKSRRCSAWWMRPWAITSFQPTTGSRSF